MPFGPAAAAAALKRVSREKPHDLRGIMGVVAPKSPETPGIRLDVGEELRAGRVQMLRHVAQIAELRARVGALERRWSSPTITAVAAIVTALGSVGYLLVNHQ